MKKVILIFLIPFSVFAQTHIYRSLQPGKTSAIGTSTGTLSISGSTATFSVAQPDSVGVGDAIQYDASGDDGVIDAICFIHGRTSSTVYTVKAANGGTPTTVTGDGDHDIFRAYTSFVSVEGGTENTGIAAAVRNFDAANRNLDTNSEIYHLACYRGLNFGTSSQVIIDGITTSATEYLEVYTPYLESEVGTSQRHLFIAQIGSGAVNNVVFSSSTIHVRVHGLSLKASQSTSASSALKTSTSASGARFYLYDNILTESNNSSASDHYGIQIESITGAGNENGIWYVWNNIIYTFRGSGSSAGIGITGNLGARPIVYAYNNTMIDADIGIRNNFDGTSVWSINNIVQDCDDSFYGNFNSGSGYNLNDLADSPGSNNIESTSLTFGDNYHLTAASAAVAIGTNLSADANLAFTDDFDLQTRSTWNIGADEYIAPSVTPNKRRPTWWSIYNEKDIVDFGIAVR